MDSDIRAFLDMPDPGAKRVARRKGFNAFGWTVAILLLTGGVMACWIGSLYVFGHPENPDCYHFLKKLGKIEPIKRFDLTAAPQGKFFTAREFYETCLMMSQPELDSKNDELLRNYLRNYAQVKTPIPYLWGRFTTKGVYELSKSDLFPTGMAAVADSDDCPQVSIEHIYPMAFSNIPRARQMLAIDPDIRLEKSFSLGTIVHVTKLDDARMLFTVVPINYGQYAYRQGISSTFHLDPPGSMNIEAGFPVVKPSQMDNAVKTFAIYRKNRSVIAKGEMLTLESPDADSRQSADISPPRDIPPEAMQPYHPVPAIDAPPAPEPTQIAAIPAPRAVETAAQTAPAPPSAPAPVAPVAQTALPKPPAPVVAKTMAHPVIIEPVSPAPLVAAPARAATIVKQDKTPQKFTSSAQPPPAPVVRPPAGVQPPATEATTIAHPPVAARPKTPAVFAASQAPAKSAPVDPIVGRPAQYVPPPAPGAAEYARALPSAPPVSGVKLTPFLDPPVQVQQAQPVRQASNVAAPAETARWQTYNPGMMPRGKLITIEEAPQLADPGIGSERFYIDGRFIVTASSDGRAVLRSVNYNASNGAPAVRMIVEYPPGARVPMEGTQVARGELRPYQVIDVRRGDDGQVNIYAREITVPLQATAPFSTRNYRDRVVQQSYNPVD